MHGSSKRPEAIFCRAVLGIIVLITMLGITGCRGDSEGGSSDVAVPALASKLFVADAGYSAVVSGSNVNPSPGVITVDRTIAGSNTGINTIGDIAYDTANNRIYVANSKSIVVFNNASTTTGNVNPARTITSNKITHIGPMYLDTVNDVLYVVDIVGNDVLVFNNISSANGLLTPSRTISIKFNLAMFVIMDIFVDTTRDILYVSGFDLGDPRVNTAILAYDNASTLNGGAITANRALAFDNTFTHSIFVDTIENRIFAVDDYNNSIMVFDGASIANGWVVPDRTINMPALVNYIFLDKTNNRLYASSSIGLYILNGASTANGAVTTTLLITPNGSQIVAIAVAS